MGPVTIAFGALLAACQQRVANAEPKPSVSSEPPGITSAAQPEAAGVHADALGVDTPAAEQRRGYGVVDMRSNGCVEMRNDHTLRGTGCPAGIVIYGPYVSVPSNSEIEVSFDVKANKKIEIYSDIVSQMGKRTLAGLNGQTIEAGVSQRLGYRVYVFSADTNVESRIGVTADQGTEFEIANLVMTVR